MHALQLLILTAGVMDISVLCQDFPFCFNGQDPCHPEYPCEIGTLLPHPENCSLVRQCIAPYEWITTNDPCGKGEDLYNTEDCTCTIKYPTGCFNFTDANCPKGEEEPTLPDIKSEPCTNGTVCTRSNVGYTVPDIYQCSLYHNCTYNGWELRECQDGRYYNHDAIIDDPCGEGVELCKNSACFGVSVGTPLFMISTSSVQGYYTSLDETVLVEFTTTGPLSTLSDMSSTKLDQSSTQSDPTLSQSVETVLVEITSTNPLSTPDILSTKLDQSTSSQADITSLQPDITSTLLDKSSTELDRSTIQPHTTPPQPDTTSSQPDISPTLTDISPTKLDQSAGQPDTTLTTPDVTSTLSDKSSTKMDQSTKQPDTTPTQPTHASYYTATTESNTDMTSETTSAGSTSFYTELTTADEHFRLSETELYIILGVVSGAALSLGVALIWLLYKHKGDNPKRKMHDDRDESRKVMDNIYYIPEDPAPDYNEDHNCNEYAAIQGDPLEAFNTNVPIKKIGDLEHLSSRQSSLSRSSIIYNPIYQSSLALGPRPGNYGVIDV